jgi:glycosyltransferase involved in cell wall biosynthesis
MPDISVVIPTYNRNFCIGRAIASVLRQTCAAAELIVVDDGSTDNTRDLIASYGSAVKYLFQPNAGVSAARNTGVRAARSDWIAFLDSDDEWLADKLRVQCTDLSNHPQAIAHMVDCRMDGLLGEENHSQRSIFRMRNLLDEFSQHPLRQRPLCDVLTSAFFPSAWLIKRTAIEQAGYFDTSMRTSEDTDLLSRIALQGPFVVNCFSGTRLQRYGGSGGLSDLYDEARLEYFGNILKTYQHLNTRPDLTHAERALVHKEFSATHVEMALLHRRAGDTKAFRRALLGSVRVNPTLYSVLKAGVLLGIGARGYEALRKLKPAQCNAGLRRSATG